MAYYYKFCIVYYCLVYYVDQHEQSESSAAGMFVYLCSLLFQLFYTFKKLKIFN